MEYASRAVGNAGLATGIIGTALGALNGAGGLDLLNFGPRGPRGPQNEGDIPVTRHDMAREEMTHAKHLEWYMQKRNQLTDHTKTKEAAEKALNEV